MTELQRTIQFVSDADLAATGANRLARNLISIELLTDAVASELAEAGYVVANGQIVGRNENWFPLTVTAAGTASTEA